MALWLCFEQSLSHTKDLEIHTNISVDERDRLSGFALK